MDRSSATTIISLDILSSKMHFSINLKLRRQGEQGELDPKYYKGSINVHKGELERPRFVGNDITKLFNAKQWVLHP